MLKIKLARTGTKNRPSYRIVVVEAKSKLTGRSAAHLGFYNPTEKKLTFEKEVLAKWLKIGAIPTPKVRRLLKINN